MEFCVGLVETLPLLVFVLFVCIILFQQKKKKYDQSVSGCSLSAKTDTNIVF